ncbi:DUF1800 domain-containing protein [bacterium]|nr:MAG: DUF1800 domain-containing protein [bacterium]
MLLSTERDRGAHLLRRFGLGASEAELDYYLRGGIEGAVEKLLNPPEDPDSVVDLELLRNDKGNLPMPQAVNGWVLRLLMTRRPLEERMTLFWHNHFATSASKVQAPLLMIGQNETLRANALAPFPQLLDAVSKDPAMLLWLDNQENVRGKPNENFAREVMELFTLGIGHYTEKDVQEAARAFTGWAFRRGGARQGGEFLFRPRLHDAGPKTVLGRTGPFNGDDVLRILCEEPRTAEFLVTKLWDWFVWPNPDAKTVAPFAARYRSSGLDTKALLRDVMRSKEFYSDRAVRSIVKSPVDVVIVTMRQLGIGERQRGIVERGPAVGAGGRLALAPAYAAQLAMKSMGQWLFYPPDVAGWKNGAGWISSATMVERIGWGDQLFGKGKTGRASIRYPAYEFLQTSRTPEEVVQTLASVFDVRIAPERRPLLVAAAKKALGTGLTPANAPAVAATVTHLMFALPEFQFA